IAVALPSALTDDLLRTVRTEIEIFGLHAARLDIREDSGRLIAALAGILGGLGIDRGFEERDDPARADLPLRLLGEQPPKLSDVGLAAAGSDAGAETWRLFRLLARAANLYDTDPLGPFIISMTRGIADVLGVLLLARWAGCAPGLAIVPLFETLGD